MTNQNFPLCSRRTCLLAGLASTVARTQAQLVEASARANPVDWAMVLALAKGQTLPTANGLRLGVPAVAVQGPLLVELSSALGPLNWLALFVQQGAKPDKVLVAAFDCTKNAMPAYSVSVKFERTCRFYLAAMAQDSVWVAQAETKLALLQPPLLR